MIRLAITLCLALLLVGCAGTEVTFTDGKNTASIRFADSPTPVEYVKADTVPEPAPIDRAALIIEMGKLAGDNALGAELVVIAEQAAANTNRKDEDARQDALRIATWFYERSTRNRRKTGTGAVESNSRRAFGELE